MTRRLRIMLLGCAVTAMAGCAGHSGDERVSQGANTPAPAAAPAASVTGTWVGWAGVGARDAPVTMNLMQKGPNVTGEVAVGGRPDLSGQLVGLVQGNGIRLELANGYGSLPEMTVNHEQISGNIGGLPFNLQRAR